MIVNKLLRQNSIINQKIDKLLSITESLEERMEKSDVNNVDQAFVDVSNITSLYVI